MADARHEKDPRSSQSHTRLQGQAAISSHAASKLADCQLLTMNGGLIACEKKASITLTIDLAPSRDGCRELTFLFSGVAEAFALFSYLLNVARFSRKRVSTKTIVQYRKAKG